jgi:hypothetical protein
MSASLHQAGAELSGLRKERCGPTLGEDEDEFGLGVGRSMAGARKTTRAKRQVSQDRMI